MKKASILCYGASGAGKSTQARYFARYVWDVHKKRTRFICTDGGSLWSCLEDYIDEGFVDALLVPTDPTYNPFSVMRKLGRGEWPDQGRINQPVPVKVGMEMKWKSNTVWKPWTQHETDTVGLICTDSLTGYSSAFMYDAAVKNIRIGEEGGAPRDEDGEKLGTNTRNHYGDAQNEIKNYINAIVALPCPFSYFTALEDGGTENSTGVKRPVFGPQIAGSAATGELPKLVTNCFHLVADGVGADRKVKAFYDEHEDPSLPSKMKWKAKASSILPEQRLDFVKRFPGGFIPLSLENGIRDFMTFKDLADEKLRSPRVQTTG